MIIIAIILLLLVVTVIGGDPLFILELLFTGIIGVIAYTICSTTNNKPLGNMVKLATAMICLLVTIQTLTPVVKFVKGKQEQPKVEKKVERTLVDWLMSKYVLTEQERNGGH